MMKKCPVIVTNGDGQIQKKLEANKGQQLPQEIWKELPGLDNVLSVSNRDRDKHKGIINQMPKQYEFKN